MRDLTSPTIIHVKGLLFLGLGLLAALLILRDTATLHTAALLGVCMWASCRFYYWAFYVIEHYVDPTFRFTGLTSVVRHLLRRRQS